MDDPSYATYEIGRAIVVHCTHRPDDHTKNIGRVTLETLQLRAGARVPKLDHTHGVARDDGAVSKEYRKTLPNDHRRKYQR
jgi:hypothetical protein